MADDSPLPVMFIYRGEQIVACKVLRPKHTLSLSGTISYEAQVDDLPEGDYEYELSTEVGTRYGLTIKRKPH